MKSVLALLGYLAESDPKYPQPREILAELLWPGMSTEYGRKNLRQTLYELNKQITKAGGVGLLLVTRHALQRNPNASLELDTDLFEQALKSPTLANLQQAVSLYRGDFLGNFFLPGSADFENWLQSRREYYRERYREALHTLISLDPSNSTTYARRLLESDPFNEAAARKLMLKLAEKRGRAEAIQQYETIRRTLWNELGVQPELETTILYEQIMRGESGKNDDPNTTPTSAKTSSSLHLPGLATPFIGRRSEVEQVKTLLQGLDYRLITLTGPGGTGKTRLAIQAASELGEMFTEGVFFVSLAPLQTLETVISAVAKALEFSFYHEQEKPLQQLLGYLRQKQILLILDNFEHLLEAVPLITQLLTSAPGVKLIVTSRIRLNLQSEFLFPVEGMEIPEPAVVNGWNAPEIQAKPYSALSLFTERARQSKATFNLTTKNVKDVLEICRLVQGMPLGIELAAAWLELLSPEDIAAEIARNLDFLETEQSDVPIRQRSIRAVFESAWKLLPAQEREVFRKLCVFAGSFSREAAQRVSGASLQTLLKLANKSWLQQTDEKRFQLHELMRQYGVERLKARGEEWQTTEATHANYYAEFMEIQGRELRGARQIAALDQIDLEFDTNFRAAWDWLVDRKQFAVLVDKILPGLFHFGWIRGHHTEAIVSMTKRARKAIPASNSRQTLTQFAVMATVETYIEFRGAVFEDQSRQRLEELWKTVIEEKLANEMGFWYIVLIDSYQQKVNFEEGKKRYSEILSSILSEADSWELGFGLLTTADLEENNRQQQEIYLKRALKIFQKIGVITEQGYTLLKLADLANLKRAFDESVQLYLTAKELFSQVGDYYFGVNTALYKLTMLYMRNGHVAKAFQVHDEWREKLEKSGNRRRLSHALSVESIHAIRHSTFQHALLTRQRSVDLALEVGNQNDIAWHLWELGDVYRQMGDFDQARKFYRDAHPLFENLRDSVGLGYYYRGLGEIAREQSQWVEAHLAFRKAEDFISRDLVNHEMWSLCYVLAGLGYILIELGELSEARVKQNYALHLAIEWAARDLELVVLLGRARLFVAEGQPEKAIELATLIAHHPVSWNETKNRADVVLIKASAGLSEASVEAAQMRGRLRKLKDTIAEIIW